MIIRQATMDDYAGLVALFTEMQAHYGVPCPPEEDIRQRLMTRPEGAEILVADIDGKISGFAAFSAIYPGPGLHAGLFLKELYVLAGQRGSGAGRALLRQLAVIALERGFKRVDWTADAENPRLLAFYEDLGAKPKPDKVFFRLDGEALLKLGT